MCLLPMYGVIYFYYLYYSQISNSLRHEYLQGVAISIMYTWPLWLVVAGAGIGMRKKLTTTNFVLSLVPVIFMILAFLSLIL